MSEEMIVSNVDQARALMARSTGLVVVSVVGCEPCQYVWEALQDSAFADQARTKVELSIRSREDCAFFRDLKIREFPTVIRLAEGVETARAAGAPCEVDSAAVAAWLQERLSITTAPTQAESVGA